MFNAITNHCCHDNEDVNKDDHKVDFMNELIRGTIYLPNNKLNETNMSKSPQYVFSDNNEKFDSFL